ncbi:uncharacterized protein LACBIDRAFT_294751 [Laccaria bicolor S238N-H82]|uniref:Predicted protein n=1 Tax=Laccaria bicolor (strain S238N-H82 / ATCC MYA-4686) TaxID=486041 RepID=B0DHH7_LACBS|nr:uncharacterized protein LACBIDRAFT_294751 [Laccaria bicolor S238N-H82]EDR06023.1 predicted protein [Laccaria bicolor S238N-H82]|eukprot:XP_001883311.1 predicted protein [Laccaria bicolor S238N-H82]
MIRHPMSSQRISGSTLASVVKIPTYMEQWPTLDKEDPLALLHAKFWGKNMADEEQRWLDAQKANTAGSKLGLRDQEGEKRIDAVVEEKMVVDETAPVVDETMDRAATMDPDDDFIPGCYTLDIGIDGLMSKLWIQAEYIRVFNFVSAYYDKPSSIPRAPCVVVTGQPGITGRVYTRRIRYCDKAHTLRNHSRIDESRTNEIFDQLGPTPRLCIDFQLNSEAMSRYELDLRTALSKVTLNDLELLLSTARCGDMGTDTLSEKIALLSRESLDDMHSQGVVNPITPYIQSRLANRFRNLEHKELLRLYKAFARGENEWPSTYLVPLFVLLEYTLATTPTTFEKLPVFAVIQHYFNYREKTNFVNPIVHCFSKTVRARPAKPGLPPVQPHSRTSTGLNTFRVFLSVSGVAAVHPGQRRTRAGRG